MDKYNDKNKQDICNRSNIGNSCHQCKNSRPQKEQIFCMNTDIDVKTLRKCRKKFCFTCQERSYDINQGSIPDITVWRCPACTNLCTCASCRRLLQVGLGSRSKRSQYNIKQKVSSIVDRQISMRVSRSKSKKNQNNHLLKETMKPYHYHDVTCNNVAIPSLSLPIQNTINNKKYDISQEKIPNDTLYTQNTTNNNVNNMIMNQWDEQLPLQQNVYELFNTSVVTEPETVKNHMNNFNTNFEDVMLTETNLSSSSSSSINAIQQLSPNAINIVPTTVDNHHYKQDGAIHIADVDDSGIDFSNYFFRTRNIITNTNETHNYTIDTNTILDDANSFNKSKQDYMVTPLQQTDLTFNTFYTHPFMVPGLLDNTLGMHLREP